VPGLLGEYRHTIDEKGRITLPARIREELGPVFVATKGLDGCIFLYPDGEWQALEAKLRALPQTQKDVRAFVRLFFAGASECRPDAQGRVLLPQPLRQYAALEREGVIVGVASRVEIWRPDAWEAFIAQADEGFAEIAERVGGLGL
jgi:MraZ protein